MYLVTEYSEYHLEHIRLSEATSNLQTCKQKFDFYVKEIENGHLKGAYSFHDLTKELFDNWVKWIEIVDKVALRDKNIADQEEAEWNKACGQD